MTCPTAIEVLERSLESLVYIDENGESEVVALTQFRHDSPGLQLLRHKIAVTLVRLIEESPDAMAELHKLHLKQRRQARNA